MVKKVSTGKKEKGLPKMQIKKERKITAKKARKGESQTIMERKKRQSLKLKLKISNLSKKICKERGSRKHP